MCGNHFNHLCVTGKNYNNQVNCQTLCFLVVFAGTKTLNTTSGPRTRRLNSVFEYLSSNNGGISGTSATCDDSTTHCYFSCKKNHACSNGIILNCPYDDTNLDSCEYCQLTCEENGCDNIVFSSMNCKEVYVEIAGQNGLSNNSTIYGPGVKIDDNSYSYSAKSLMIQTSGGSRETYMSNTTVYVSKYGNNNTIEVQCYESVCQYNTFYVYNSSTFQN